MDEDALAEVGAAKSALRSRLLERRAGRPDDERAAAADGLARQVLGLPEAPGARTVAAYVSRPVEPGTDPLLDALDDRGVRILVPVAQPGHVLDWAVFEGRAGLVPSRLPGHGSLHEPTGPLLGPDGLGEADLVVAPALAVTAGGTRLGHGAGYYDRALAYVRPGVLVVAAVFDDEVLDTLPSTVHDRRVAAVVTPTRVIRVAAPAPRTP